jgi:hypothetical protein
MRSLRGQTQHLRPAWASTCRTKEYITKKPIAGRERVRISGEQQLNGLECGGQRRDRTADAGLFRAAWQSI